MHGNSRSAIRMIGIILFFGLAVVAFGSPSLEDSHPGIPTGAGQPSPLLLPADTGQEVQRPRAAFSGADPLGLNLAFGGKTMGNSQHLVLGGGCFWCVEAVYERIQGVLSVVAGYSGGNTPNPTYQEVGTGKTNHAEVVRIEYDPDQVGFRELVDLFWYAHDPTTENRQGFDVGTQYRSIIFYQNDQERAAIEESKNRAQADFSDPIVTVIKGLEQFFPAEAYHQDFYANNPNYGYCQAVIQPKMRKLGLEGIKQISIPEMTFKRSE